MVLKIFENEKTFVSAESIKYVFERSKQGSDYLVVVFSGFGPVDAPPLYNYIRSLKTLDTNKLFILDQYGVDSPKIPIGCYFLGKDRKFSVESSVIALIAHIAAQNQIDFKNIIACGSSKGGTASLYFGIKYGFGYVVAGAPQVFIGSYLFGIEHAVEVGNYISGGTSKKDSRFLDNLLPDVIENANHFPNIQLHVSSTDHHYKGHIQPLLKMLKRKKASYQLDLQNYPDGHSRLGVYFKKYLLNTLSLLVGKEVLEVKTNIEQINKNRFRFGIEVESQLPMQFAWYIIQDEVAIDKIWYSPDNILEYEFQKPGDYEVQYFIKNSVGDITIDRFDRISII